MRRVAATAVVLAACAALVLFATGAGGGGGGGGQKGTYWVQLDNAFGLVGGADVKVAGVRAGKITGMKLDRRNLKALVQIKVTKGGPLHADTFCETRPQSLIGEYFIDCQPGTSRDVLKGGATIPVTHTASTVPPDLINDIMRLPYRERLRIIVDELGTGLAGRSGDLNSAIRRAVPALRETDKVLRILGEQNKVIRDLTQNSDTVITAIARNKRDVGRWVVAARNTAEASAERRTALAQTFHNLPAFLARAPSDHGVARADRGRPDARPAQPGRGRRSAPPLPRRPRSLLERLPAGRAVPGHGVPDRSRGGHRRPADREPPAPVRHQHPRVGQEPRDRPRAPRQPPVRGGERPPQPRRSGLHRTGGAAHLRLRPDARHQHP